MPCTPNTIPPSPRLRISPRPRRRRRGDDPASAHEPRRSARDGRALPLCEGDAFPDALANEGDGAPLSLPLRLRAAVSEAEGVPVSQGGAVAVERFEGDVGALGVAPPPPDALAAGVNVRVRVAAGDADALFMGDAEGGFESEGGGDGEGDGDAEEEALSALVADPGAEPLPPPERLPRPLAESRALALRAALALAEPLCESVPATEVI